ncbi:hypothetical protein B0H14DRAFT_2563597 [Mycena olivaceomarginata]|nr:hypothetical protein B0H14DRAFT_2563597 [Mycena olivaceomarginata]
MAPNGAKFSQHKRYRPGCAHFLHLSFAPAGIWTFAVQPSRANLSIKLRGAAAADIFQAQSSCHGVERYARGANFKYSRYIPRRQIGAHISGHLLFSLVAPIFQQAVPQIAALQLSIAGHSVPHAANAVQALSLPSNVATPMADDGSQRLAMAIAYCEYQSRLDSLILNHGVTFLPPPGRVMLLQLNGMSEDLLALRGTVLEQRRPVFIARTKFKRCPSKLFFAQILVFTSFKLPIPLCKSLGHIQFNRYVERYTFDSHFSINLKSEFIFVWGEMDFFEATTSLERSVLLNCSESEPVPETNALIQLVQRPAQRSNQVLVETYIRFIQKISRVTSKKTPKKVMRGENGNQLGPPRRRPGSYYLSQLSSPTGTTDEVELGEFPELKIQGKCHELNRESTHPNTLSIRCHSPARQVSIIEEKKDAPGVLYCNRASQRSGPEDNRGVPTNWNKTLSGFQPGTALSLSPESAILNRSEASENLLMDESQSANNE